jgi:hypothetical protein
MVSPLQGWGDFGGTFTRPFRPGYHIEGFQPYEERGLMHDRIVELDAARVL